MGSNESLKLKGYLQKKFLPALQALEEQAGDLEILPSPVGADRRTLDAWRDAVRTNVETIIRATRQLFVKARFAPVLDRPVRLPVVAGSDPSDAATIAEADSLVDAIYNNEAIVDAIRSREASEGE